MAALKSDAGGGRRWSESERKDEISGGKRSGSEKKGERGERRWQ